MSPVHMLSILEPAIFPQVNSQVPGKILYKHEFSLALIPAYLRASHSYFQFLYLFIANNTAKTLKSCCCEFLSACSPTLEGKPRDQTSLYNWCLKAENKCSKNTVLTEMFFFSTKVIHKKQEH